MIAVGIDLAGSERRPTGFCIMDERMTCSSKVLHSDEEVISETLLSGPDIVSIDAPLFLPKGRPSIDQKGPPHFRECDKELLRMKIRFFPISLGPMRMLTKRGMKLRTIFEERNLKVIESFPGAIQDILKMPRKQAGLLDLQTSLERYGVSVTSPEGDLSGDELDSITSALVGLMYLNDDYRAIGDPEEGLMILPRESSSTAPRRSRAASALGNPRSGF